MPFSNKKPSGRSSGANGSGQTGESLTEAVLVLFERGLERIAAGNAGRSLADELDQMPSAAPRCRCGSSVPADEILGYDERGPHAAWSSIPSQCWRFCRTNRSRRRLQRGIQADTKRLISAATVPGERNRAGRLGREAVGRELDLFCIAPASEGGVGGCPIGPRLPGAAFRSTARRRHTGGPELRGLFLLRAGPKRAGQPLLFKGDDFARTDIRAAAGRA